MPSMERQWAATEHPGGSQLGNEQCEPLQAPLLMEDLDQQVVNAIMKQEMSLSSLGAARGAVSPRS